MKDCIINECITDSSSATENGEAMKDCIKCIIDFFMEVIKKPWVQGIITILIGAFLYLGVTAIIYCIIDDNSKYRKKNWFNIGYRFFSKLFSFESLLATLLITALVLVIMSIGMPVGDLTTLTISFTLASIIPFIIGRTIAKNEIDKIIENKFDKRFETITATYKTSINSLRRSNAHYRRIAAELLNNSTGTNDKEWAIGWAAEAIISYILIYDTYPKGKEYAIKCGEIIQSALETIKNEEETRDNTNNDIHVRTLKSILTMHALKSIEKKDNFGEIKDKTLEEIEELLVKKANVKDISRFSRQCVITDLNDEDKMREIQKEIESILNQISPKK